MKQQRLSVTLHPVNGKTAALLYVCEHFDAGDTLPIIYTNGKLSIMLSDGLAGVTGGRAYPTRRGDVLLFSPDEIHYGRFLSAGVYRYLDLYVPRDFFAAWPDQGAGFACLFDEKDDRRTNLLHPAEEREQLLASAERIAELMAQPTGTAETEIVGRVLTILALCAERYRRREPRALPDVPPLVTRTVRFIENRFAQPVTLKEIAAECGCSVTYLTRTFRQHTGKTVYALLMEYRLFHAQQLLAAGKSVTEACFASGFNDCSSFIRFFKDKVGVTPKNYRKEKSPS